MSLSNKDYQAMLDIIAEMAHAFPDRSATFLVLCERLDRLIGISSAVLLPITPATQAFEYPRSNHLSLHADPSTDLDRALCRSRPAGNALGWNSQWRGAKY